MAHLNSISGHTEVVQVNRRLVAFTFVICGSSPALSLLPCDVLASSRSVATLRTRLHLPLHIEAPDTVSPAPAIAGLGRQFSKAARRAQGFIGDISQQSRNSEI